ncbi:hypothetical protein ACFYKX_11475 [Cytobacillus sp. FJAT-54145]|uniref:Uncharacterized protein n=1 Tax=Cytobacillus spartinae TaxID=3299023 RepID=A0ABW6KAM2_9BACI
MSSTICEHGFLKRSCETCYLKEEISILKTALQQIADTKQTGFSESGHQQVIKLAEKALANCD